MSIYGIRFPVPKPGHRMRSKRDYDRRNNEKEIEFGLTEEEQCERCEELYNCWDCPIYLKGIGGGK